MTALSTTDIQTNPVQTDIYGHVVEHPEPSYLSAGRTLSSWLFSLDHKRIGILYMVSTLSMFLLGGIFAMLMRTELIAPGVTMPAANPATAWERYNHLFTLHGTIMVFLFIVPSVLGILGNFVLPMQLGARDMAFPRLNLLSWYLYMVGAAFFLWVLATSGLDTGWTFYTPYSTRTSTAVIGATAGIVVLGFSSIVSGVNFIASVHMLRAPKQGWLDLPLFIWGIYATSILQILATPVLAITLLLLICERTLGVGIFDPALGGNPVLYQDFFWFYSHPAVYIMILPSFGIISELISVHSRKHIFGYSFIAASSIGIALLSFLVWGHHMFVSGQAPVTSTIFSLLSFGIAIPSAIKVFNWLATLYGGSIRLNTPMLYALGFLWLFAIGGLTGVFVAALSVDVHLTDTYFVVGHFHYVMVGSMLFALIGGLYHWWPKMFGKMYSEKWGRIAWGVVFIGFNLTFFVQLVMGAQGMPRRYADYPAYFWPYHMVSSIGAYILGIGLLMVLGTWIWSWIKGSQAPANPWGANSLEWYTVSPAPPHNFDYIPYGSDPYDFDDWKYDENIDGYVLTKPDRQAPPHPHPQPKPQHQQA